MIPDIKLQKFDNPEFMAMLAHDMKTPVKAQIRAINLLVSGMFGEFSQDVKNILLNISASNKYLQNILDNVMTDYRINKGKFIIHKTPSDIRKTIESAVLNIGILSEIKEQKIEIKYLTQNTKRNYDEVEIQRVIINLLSNAFEYSPEKSLITLTVEEDFSYIKVSAKSLIKPNSKSGTGLGLSICRNIIEAHGGKIQIKTDEKGEFEVDFLLP